MTVESLHHRVNAFVAQIELMESQLPAGMARSIVQGFVLDARKVRNDVMDSVPEKSIIVADPLTRKRLTMLASDMGITVDEVLRRAVDVLLVARQTRKGLDSKPLEE